MAHFAQINPINNIVLRVVVISNEVTHDDNGIENEDLGIAHCKKLFGDSTTWIQTSYNGSFRGCYAGVGYTYDPEFDAFIPPPPEKDDPFRPFYDKYIESVYSQK